MSAAEVYIQRCNKAPCGDTEIHLYLGADSSELQNRRERLLKFLKGSQKEKVKLQKENPEEYSSFERVWSVRERHMVKEVPSQYGFFLLYGLKMDPQFPTYLFLSRIRKDLGAVKDVIAAQDFVRAIT